MKYEDLDDIPEEYENLTQEELEQIKENIKADQEIDEYLDEIW